MTPWRIEVIPLSRPHDGIVYAQAPQGMGTSYNSPITAIISAKGKTICHDAEYYSKAPTAGEMEHIVQCVNAWDNIKTLRERVAELERAPCA